MKLQLVAVLALSALTAVASEESHAGMVSDKEFVALSELKNAERSSPLEGLSDKPVIREISGETFRALASKPGYKTHLQMSFEDGTDGLVSERRFSTLRNPEGFEHVRTYVERPEFSEHNVRTVAERPFSSGAVEHFYNNDRPVEGEFSDVRVFNKHHPIESVPAYLQRASIREIPDFAGSAVREVPVGRRFEGNFAPQSRVFESTYEPQEFVNKFEGPVSKSFVESSFVPKSRYIESSFGPKTRYIESSFGPKTRYIESRTFA